MTSFDFAVDHVGLFSDRFVNVVYILSNTPKPGPVKIGQPHHRRRRVKTMHP